MNDYLYSQTNIDRLARLLVKMWRPEWPSDPQEVIKRTNHLCGLNRQGHRIMEAVIRVGGELCAS